VTLGAIHGLLAGKKLVVYGGDKKLGQVIVDISFDVISYVHPQDKSMQLPTVILQER